MAPHSLRASPEIHVAVERNAPGQVPYGRCHSEPPWGQVISATEEPRCQCAAVTARGHSDERGPHAVCRVPAVPPQLTRSSGRAPGRRREGWSGPSAVSLAPTDSLPGCGPLPDPDTAPRRVFRRGREHGAHLAWGPDRQQRCGIGLTARAPGGTTDSRQACQWPKGWRAS